MSARLRVRRRGVRRARSAAATASKFKVGKSTQASCTLTKAVKYSRRGRRQQTVKLALTSEAALAAQASASRCRVTITVTPASGTAFTQKLTLKRVSRTPDRGPRRCAPRPSRRRWRRARAPAPPTHEPELLPVQLRRLLARHGRHDRRHAERRRRRSRASDHPQTAQTSSAALPAWLAEYGYNFGLLQVGPQRDPGDGVGRGARRRTPRGRRRSTSSRRPPRPTITTVRRRRS